LQNGRAQSREQRFERRALERGQVARVFFRRAVGHVADGALCRGLAEWEDADDGFGVVTDELHAVVRRWKECLDWSTLRLEPARHAHDDDKVLPP